jgi:pyruvate carboxylase
MRTSDMLAVGPATSHLLANAGSLEMWGGATFDVALRFLHECPWKRLEKLREAIPNVPFQVCCSVCVCVWGGGGGGKLGPRAILRH